MLRFVWWMEATAVQSSQGGETFAGSNVSWKPVPVSFLPKQPMLLVFSHWTVSLSLLSQRLNSLRCRGWGAWFKGLTSISLALWRVGFGSRDGRASLASRRKCSPPLSSLLTLVQSTEASSSSWGKLWSDHQSWTGLAWEDVGIM